MCSHALTRRDVHVRSPHVTVILKLLSLHPAAGRSYSFLRAGFGWHCWEPDILIKLLSLFSSEFRGMSSTRGLPSYLSATTTTIRTFILFAPVVVQNRPRHTLSVLSPSSEMCGPHVRLAQFYCKIVSAMEIVHVPLHVILLLAIVVCLQPDASAKKASPNIWVLFADDLTIQTLTLYQGRLAHHIKTPNIDRLAKGCFSFP
eukprot:g69009.t1